MHVVVVCVAGGEGLGCRAAAALQSVAGGGLSLSRRGLSVLVLVLAEREGFRYLPRRPNLALLLPQYLVLILVWFWYSFSTSLLQ